MDRGVTLSSLVGHRGSRCHTQRFGRAPWIAVSHSVLGWTSWIAVFRPLQVDFVPAVAKGSPHIFRLDQNLLHGSKTERVSAFTTPPI